MMYLNQKKMTSILMVSGCVSLSKFFSLGTALLLIINYEYLITWLFIVIIWASL